MRERIVQERKERSETLERKHNDLARESEVKRVLLAKQPLYILYCKDHILTTDNFDKTVLPASVENLVQEFRDVFPEEVPVGLPPLRGIEHHIDLMLGVSLPNRPAYRSNPQVTKEIQKQVGELMGKGWVRESMSPCVICNAPKK